MRIIVLVLSLFFSIQLTAQKNCDYSTNVTDSVGTYRETKGYLMHEKVFGGKATYVFFTLANEDRTPFLKVQKIEKSTDFISANCFDQQSKVYIQLLNGKIITLVYSGEDTCGNLVRQPNDPVSSRIVTGNFLFLKGSIEDLKSSPIWEIRIRYATETVDFAVKKEFVSELINETFTPETYFVNYLHCIID